MNKKAKTAIGRILIVILFLIFSMIILDEKISKMISTLCILFSGAWFLFKGLQITGVPELISCIGLPCTPILARLFAATPFAESAATLYNSVLVYVHRAMGITTDLQTSPETLQIGPETSIALTFLMLFALIALIYNLPDHTAMKKRKGHDKEEFREKNFAEKSKMFCVNLRQKLESIDRETNWEEDRFTPIEAEVEINIKGKKKRKYQDLLKSLKSIRHPGTIFLVLGEPGSGKSVSLRKLSLDLLKESQETKKIPVYINLKQWNEDWNLNRLPTKSDLLAFIKNTLCDGSYNSDKDFVDAYFDKMFEDGRWYFIFDSFDEMPCLMGKQSCQELIDKISELLYQFMTGIGQSGGIIASRPYKSPSEAISATVILKIREFSDSKIRTMLKKSLKNGKTAGNELFGKRENLVALCRNPFYLTLLINYIQDKGLQFPESQMDLYCNFVESRLKKCSDMLEMEGLTAQQVHDAAKKLAARMQDSTVSGLEYPTAALFQGKDAQNWQKAIRILEYAKICRLGGAKETVTFVHRRFQEFFLVESIMESGQSITYEHYESIVQNSGMRDALVLYCEVVKEEKAREIAGFCFKTIKKNIAHVGNICEKGCLELVNTLYFMTEAFRNRKSALAKYEKELESLIEHRLNNNTDFVVLLAFANSMVLFDQKYLQKIVLKVFQLQNRWLNDIIMQNCRIIRQLDTQIESQFLVYFFQTDIRTFWARFRDVHFSLSLSKGFRYVKTLHLMIFLIESVCIVSFFLSLLYLCLSVGLLSANGAQAFPEMEGMLSKEILVRFTPIYINFIFYTFSLLTILPSLKEETSHFICFHIIAFLPLINTIIISGSIGIVWSTILTSLFFLFFLLQIVHNRKNLFRWKTLRGLLCKTSFLILAAIILFIALFGGLTFLIKTKPLSTVILFCGIILFVPITYVVKESITLAVHYFQDRLFLHRQLNLNIIERKNLTENLRKLHSWRCQRIYVETLLQNKVRLTGQWPGGVRPSTWDSRLELNLAKLDCASLDSCDYLFKI